MIRCCSRRVLVSEATHSMINQFPSAQISAEPSYGWYSNEVYTRYLHGEAGLVFLVFACPYI